MIVACHHISKGFPEGQVLQDVTFHLEKGDKAAIVGVNGAGKTTLLRIMTGEMEPDEGSVSFARDCTWGYFAQDQALTSDATIYEELLKVKQPVIDMERRIAEDERLMGTLRGEALNNLMAEYTALLQRFEEEEGYAYKGEVLGVMRGLGFTEADRDKRIMTLSGGQKTRVALGRLLLQKPSILILDEPTNHLDIGSIRWLETYLMNYRGTVLIVSHDRYFLDRTVTKILELENGRCLMFGGNYTSYAERKEALREQERRAYLNNQAQIRHQEQVIEKLRRFNREKSIRRAESREKMLARVERVEKPVQLRDDMHLTLTPCIKSGREVLTVEDLAMSYGDHHLFSGLSMKIRRGEHVALIGDNGTGKTTILKILNDLVTPDDGVIRLGTNVHIGYYDQEHHVLTDSNTVFEEISDAFPGMNNTEIRSLLAAFLFTGDDVFKTIGDLSGGEKGRVSLAKLMLSKANFLILDEPTNHLDIVSKEVLENALNSYEGTVLYVSHDRYFINRTASRILRLENKVLESFHGNNSETAPEKFLGNYDYYLEKTSASAQSDTARTVFTAAGERQASGSSSGTQTSSAASTALASQDPSASSAEPANSKQAYLAKKEEEARQRKAAGALKKIENEISALEEAIGALDERMSQPEVATDLPLLTQLVAEKEEKEETLAELYEKWEEAAAAV